MQPALQSAPFLWPDRPLTRFRFDLFRLGALRAFAKAAPSAGGAAKVAPAAEKKSGIKKLAGARPVGKGPGKSGGKRYRRAKGVKWVAPKDLPAPTGKIVQVRVALGRWQRFERALWLADHRCRH